MLVNRKGQAGENISIFTYLFFMIVIGVGLYVGLNLFFIQGYEFRVVEADLLNYKIRECIIDNNVDDNFRENFYDVCRLKRDVVEKYNLIRICKNSDDCISERDENSLLIGEGSKFQACKFKGGKENDFFPRCVIKSFVKGRDRFEVITGSTQISRRRLG